jgi:hypothetical protein
MRLHGRGERRSKWNVLIMLNDASPSRATRTCPFCAEEVLLAAKLCKHCGSKLDPTVVQHNTSNTTPSPYAQVTIAPAVVRPANVQASGVAANVPAAPTPSPRGQKESFPVGLVFAVGAGAFLLVTVIFVVLVGSQHQRGVGGFSGDDCDEIAVGIANHWRPCGTTEVDADGIRMMIGRNVWPDADANRCLLCLDEHPGCSEQAACEAACRIASNEAPVSALASFGGSANPALFGTWESNDPQHATYLTLVFDAANYSFTATGPQGSQTRTGVWAAVQNGASWRTFMEPQDDPAAATVKTFDVVGPDLLRWTDAQNGGGTVTWHRRSSVPTTTPPKPAAPSSEHVDECNRACRPFRECMRDLEDMESCSEELTRACRTCRTEGLGRGRP